jgi:hypothetical protein
MENSRFTPSSAAEAGPKLPESDDDKKDRKKTKSGTGLSIDKSISKSEKADPVEGWAAFKLFDRPDTTNNSAEKQALAPPAVAEKLTPDQEMTLEDLHYAAVRIAAERQAEIDAGPADVDAESQAATAAAHEFYQKIVDDQQSPDEAAVGMFDELHGVDDLDPASETEAGEVPIGRTTEPDHTSSYDEAPFIEDNEINDQASDSGHPVEPASSSVNGGGSPPLPPRPGRTNGEAPDFGPDPGGPISSAEPIGPAFTSSEGRRFTEAAPADTRTEYVAYYDRSRAASDILIGGIVGYLVGRRRGRIKTERKMMPIQKKLEREVSGLKQDILKKEFTIREAARTKVRLKRQSLPREATVSLHAVPASPEAVILSTRERRVQNEISTPKPEKKRSVTLPAPESIGKVLVAAEIVSTGSDSNIEQKIASTEKQSAERQVETLSRNELLTLSEKVIVEGSTLRQVYETHLISERGLRRLVSEYLRGGDVVRAFQREIIERQIDFERDPKLRDTVRKGLKSSGGTSSTLQKLLAQAGVSTDEESLQDIARARADQLHAVKKQTKRRSQRKIVDVSLITIIGVLLAGIIMLAINRM